VDLINHFGSRPFDRANVPDDLFGNAYEYLIRNFASKTGKSSGEFYTPKEVAFLDFAGGDPYDRFAFGLPPRDAELREMWKRVPRWARDGGGELDTDGRFRAEDPGQAGGNLG
jgi:hypothetical protein